MSIIKPYKPISEKYKTMSRNIRDKVFSKNDVYYSKYTYLLDNGHGGILCDLYQTSGKRSPEWKDGTQVFEGDFNRSIVHKLSSLLSYFLHIDHYLICPEDTDVKLSDRVSRANNIEMNKGDCIFISIHANAFKYKSVNGFEVWTYKGQNIADKLAEKIYSRIVSLTGMQGRADKTDEDHDKETDKFYVLRKTSMPSLLTENGFMTNKEESDLMLNDDFRDRVAWAHFLAILELENIL